MKAICLYGVAGARDAYRVIRYDIIQMEYASIALIKYTASIMKTDYPSIEHVYTIDQRYELKRDYTEACKKNSIESWAIFKDLLDTQGLRIF